MSSRRELPASPKHETSTLTPVAATLPQLEEYALLNRSRLRLPSPLTRLGSTKHADHAVISRSHHPLPIWTPSNLSGGEMLLGRELSICCDFQMRLKRGEAVAECVLAVS